MEDTWVNFDGTAIAGNGFILTMTEYPLNQPNGGTSQNCALINAYPGYVPFVPQKTQDKSCSTYYSTDMLCYTEGIIYRFHIRMHILIRHILETHLFLLLNVNLPMPVWFCSSNKLRRLVLYDLLQLRIIRKHKVYSLFAYQINKKKFSPKTKSISLI